MPEPPEDWQPYLGRKISIRYAIRGDSEYPFSEAIGVIMSASSSELTLVTRRGEVVSVAPSDVLAAKIFPA